MANDIGLKVVRGSANSVTPLSAASKRNIGLLMSRKRGPDNTPILYSTIQEDQAFFGGYLSGSYGHIVTRNLFRNSLDANVVLYGVRVVGSGSVQASSTTTLNNGISNTPTFTIMAGFKGLADKGDWGNNLSYRLYCKGSYQKDSWALLLYYNGILVETWVATTCAVLQANVNAGSIYAVISFSAEPTFTTAGDSTVLSTAKIQAGTISTIVSATAETKAAGKFTISSVNASVTQTGVVPGTYGAVGTNTMALAAYTGVVAGMLISGVGIPTGATVVSVNGTTNIVISANLTANVTASTYTFLTSQTITSYVNGTLIGSYSSGIADAGSATLVGAGLAANINAGTSTHGFTAVNATGAVTVTAPTGTGASYNNSGVGTAFTNIVTNSLVSTTNANIGVSSGGGTVGVDAVPAGIAGSPFTVTGVGTNFTSGTTPVGSALYTTLGEYIGTVAAIGSTTSLTLTAKAAIGLSNQPFLDQPFYYVTNSLAGGVYNAPVESDFYAATGIGGVKMGLAAFDGYDVQLVANSEFHTATMAVKMRDYCTNRADCLAVINMPYLASDSSLATISSSLQTSAENYAAGYNCWVQTSDGNDPSATNVWAPAIGCILGAAYLRVPYKAGDFVHIPPGGVGSYFVDIITCTPSNLTQVQINRYTRDLTINTVSYLKGTGFFVLTSRTFSTASLYMSVHIIMQTNMYVKVLQNGFPWVCQQPNTPELKRSIYASLYSYFRGEYDNAALERSVSFDVACDIVCDQSNNPLTQDRKELNADVYWIPTECAEAIKISLKRNDTVLTVSAVK